jgi:tetratricopeptide (TPR) repeat protein
VIVSGADTAGQLLLTLHPEPSEQELHVLQPTIADELPAFLTPGAAATPPAPAPTRARASPHLLVLEGTHYAQEVYDNLSVDDAKLGRAIDLYRQATAADANSIEAHSRLARALVYRGDVDEASEQLKRAHDLGESDVVTTQAELSDLYYTTALYLLQIRSSGIEQAYLTAIRLNPNNADALGAYAQWLMTHRQFAAAEPYFTDALDLDRERLSRYVDFAEYLAIKEDMDRVRALGAEIRTRFPDQRGLRALARLYETTGELDVGIAYGLRAYQMAPDDPETVAQVAELYARIGLFDEADEFEPELGVNQLYFRRDYSRLIDVAGDLTLEYPDDLRLWAMLAFARNVVGDSPEAIRVLEAAGIPIEPGSEFMNTPADESLTTYIDALLAVGGRDAEARNLAAAKAAILDPAIGQSWWILSYHSCTRAQLARLDDALTMLERITQSQGLALSPMLKDGLCFRRLADNPRYQAVLDHLEARQAALRARLPTTLQEYGVTGVRAGTQ